MEGDDVQPVAGGLPSDICAGWRVPWAWSPTEGVGCAMNPASGHTVLGMEPRRPAGGCRHGWEPLHPHGGWRMSPTAALDGDRADLTLPRGYWASGGSGPAQQGHFFASQFPTDVALLHGLQLALRSPEA